MGKIVVNGLVEKRAELAGEIKSAEQNLQVMRESLSHLDATIRLLAPDVELSRVSTKRRYRKNSLFGRGELSRAVRESLRDAHEPLSGRDIALAILEQRGLEHDAAAIKDACIGVSRTLCNMEAAGQAWKADTSGKSALWEKR